MSQTPQPPPEPSDQGPEDAGCHEDPQVLRSSRDRWRRIAVCLLVLGGLPGLGVEFTIRGKYMRVACAAEQAPHKTRCTTPTVDLGTFEP